jgi:hypothetical protein
MELAIRANFSNRANSAFNFKRVANEEYKLRTSQDNLWQHLLEVQLSEARQQWRRRRLWHVAAAHARTPRRISWGEG